MYNVFFHSAKERKRSQEPLADMCWPRKKSEIAGCRRDLLLGPSTALENSFDAQIFYEILRHARVLCASSFYRIPDYSQCASGNYIHLLLHIGTYVRRIILSVSHKRKSPHETFHS